jgi:hypothetical protein
MTAGAVLLTAGFALAGVGSEPGDLVLSPASGPLSTDATWSTTVACPSSFQGSANIYEYAGTTSFGLISSFNDSVTAPFSGLFDGSVGALLGNAGFSGSAPGTAEFVVVCYSGSSGSGSATNAMSEFVSVAAGATTYTTSSSVSGSPGPSMSASASTSPSPSISPSPSASPSPSTSASPSTSPAATPSTSSSFPSGAPATGAGGASRSGPSALLISLGATALVGSAAATGLAVRRRRRMPWEVWQTDTEPGDS